MNKEFIPYEQALALKELGFNEGCLDQYTIDGELSKLNIGFRIKNELLTKLSCSAPLYQQAFRWFRRKYGLFGDYTMGDDWNNFYWQIWRNDTMTKTYVCSSDYVFETYEEAELACLIKLIEIVKEESK